MKAAAFLKTHSEVIKLHPNFINYLLRKEVKKLSIKENKKVCKPFHISFYQHGADFIKNKTTVKLEFELYKAPRFAK